MNDAAESLPSDLAAAHAMILAERAEGLEVEAVARRAQAVNSKTEALIDHPTLASVSNTATASIPYRLIFLTLPAAARLRGSNSANRKWSRK
jgi:hypothetical protein